MVDHILLKLAVRQPCPKNPELPDQAVYSVSDGYWVLDGIALVNYSDFRKGPPTSKKGDFETGEDIKGE